MAKFLMKCINNEEDINNIDDYIDEWHKSKNNEDLHQFLGLTLSEYEQYLKNEDSLAEIVNSYKGIGTTEEEQYLMHSEEYKNLFIQRIIDRGGDSEMAIKEFEAHIEDMPEDEMGYPGFEADECMSCWEE